MLDAIGIDIEKRGQVSLGNAAGKDVQMEVCLLDAIRIYAGLHSNSGRLYIVIVS